MVRVYLFGKPLWHVKSLTGKTLRELALIIRNHLIDCAKIVEKLEKDGWLAYADDYEWVFTHPDISNYLDATVRLQKLGIEFICRESEDKTPSGVIVRVDTSELEDTEDEWITHILEDRGILV
jgi:hypothetical protein